MTDREAPPDWGFESWQDDPYEEDGWFGREQVSEPPPVVDRPHTQPVTRTPPPPTHRLPSPTVNTWTVNGQLRASSDTALTFRAPPPPWYRTKMATIALVAAASAAVAVPIVILVWPSSPATPSTSTSVAPQASTSAQPAPSSTQPIPTNALPPPAPPLPPPPPTEDPGSAPADSQPYWTRSASPPSEKPEVGVTPTPVTRTPISVAPQPRQSTQNNNSAKPGDSPRGFHCGGWC